MTNEVERLIIENYNQQTNINDGKKVAYNFYKELWKYILINKKYNFDYINIKFKVLCILNNTYISENTGIIFELIGESFSYKNHTYYEGCENYYINNCLNTNIDMRLVLELIKKDDFDYEIKDEISYYWVNINIKKEVVNKIIDNLFKKKKLIKHK